MLSLIAPTIKKLCLEPKRCIYLKSKRLRLGDRMIVELLFHFTPFFTFLYGRSSVGYFIVNQSA
ncbi:hypothetical protein DA096_02505 [Vibrio rotiferianus]|nr:hypothetical protein C1N50_18180 [Vibrio campbellii]TMX68912.1 hypothetical protein DA096_02505 [Vibrio rotiferianus]